MAVQKTQSYWDGHTLFIQEKVLLEKTTSRFWYFEVTVRPGHTYFVKISKADYEDNCLCEHGSQWRFQKGPEVRPRTCRHIHACKQFLLHEQSIKDIYGDS